jgi:hypothetical protein
MMNKKLFISIFLLTLFLYPQVEKLVHAHHYNIKVINDSSKTSVNIAPEKCAICLFEFSIFQFIQQKFYIWNDFQISYQYLLSFFTIVLDVVKHQSERGPPVI